MSRLQLLVAVFCLGAPITTTEAQAWGFGISIGVPVYPYHRPYYPGWGYYRPYAYPYGYPYIYPAAPVVVVGSTPQPVLVQPSLNPAVVAVPAVAGPALGPPPAIASAAPPAAGTIIQANNTESASRVEQLLGQLSHSQESVRRDAAMDLGRLKSAKAVDPLVKMLAADSSPAVREATARALGLIAAPQTLTALIRAAQVDQDRDVRHSAQFSVEIIRTNLRGN